MKINPINFPNLTTVCYEISEQDKTEARSYVNNVVDFFANHTRTPQECYDEFIGSAPFSRKYHFKRSR